MKPFTEAMQEFQDALESRETVDYKGLEYYVVSIDQPLLRYDEYPDYSRGIVVLREKESPHAEIRLEFLQ